MFTVTASDLRVMSGDIVITACNEIEDLAIRASQDGYMGFKMSKNLIFYRLSDDQQDKIINKLETLGFSYNTVTRDLSWEGI